MSLLAHVVVAKSLWLDRIEQQEPSVAVWPSVTLPELLALIDRVEQRWARFVSAPVDMQRVVRYQNSKGETWTSSVDDIISHLLMHGAYHRGQLASSVRSAGGTPAYTDYIHATRSNLI